MLQSRIFFRNISFISSQYLLIGAINSAFGFETKL